MTEDRVFRILLGLENKDCDHPTLQIETVNELSKSLSNIIYESFKNKSSSSHSKRNGVLVKQIFYLLSMCLNVLITEIHQQDLRGKNFTYKFRHRKTFKINKAKF